MGKHLVFVGGGHAHLTSLKNLGNFIRRGHQVTLISLSAYHYYSGMGPGMLSGIYRPQEVRFHVKKLVEDRGGRFMEDKVTKIDPIGRLLFLHSGKEVNYDIVSFNTGSEVPAESLLKTPQENVLPVKPVIHLLNARQFVLNRLEMKHLHCVVIGGGPGGVEVTANLWRLIHQSQPHAKITLIAGKSLLGDFPEKARALALTSLSSRGVDVIEGNYVKAVEKETVLLKDGQKIPFDMALLGVGIKPSPLFKNSGLPTGEDGGLLTNAYLQSTAYPNIYGGGDCISLDGYPLARVGVYAVRQNPVLYHNLLTALDGGEMKVFKPQKSYLLIFNMGDGSGIFWRKNCVWKGRFAFLLKDYIDHRFMKRFQVSGELTEK
jgi:NADH dehydrogenase FAD-containing subunit